MMKSCVTISLVKSLRGGPWIYWDELDVSIGKAGAAGFDAVELFTASADAVDADALAKVLDETGMKVAAVGTGAGKALKGLCLTSTDEQVRARATEFIGEMIDFGARFGAPAIIGSMQGCVEAGAERRQVLDWLAEGLDELGPRAGDQGVKLIYEPLNRYETNLINRLADGVELVESLSCDNVCLLADLFHMNIEEQSLSDAVRSAGGHIGHVHFADSNRRPVGMGHTDMVEVAMTLRDIGYDGYVSAEAFAWPDSDSAAAQTINAFEKFLAAAGAKSKQ